MKLDFDEKIIRKARFASGGTPYAMSYNNLLNLYLTNKRLYAEIMLIHIRVADIPFPSISGLEFMKTLGASLPVAVYKADNKKKKFYFYVHGDLDGWIRDLSNNLKEGTAQIAPGDMKPNTVYQHTSHLSVIPGIGAVLFAIIIFAPILITPAQAENISFTAGIIGALVAIIVILTFVTTWIKKQHE
ncbi:MAG: hypothetical protein A7316_04165 [Candidatus Altiarchaeales archaeon WOR_SM1_86-2]|nr:MAG: hypothetical protein A7316_04165 [Candidatus Altiarchaeales archaeon WOR_SM1_86-2]ODS41459.1 MAG: hypothetical protein A7315_06115 [Candidatus Altiarchaeales archaeon WOR_SM1_79]